jgi:putative ABC transport system permease protein
MVAGKLTDISQPDAVIIDEAGYRQLWPGEPVRLGRIFEMNDRRAVLVGLCKASPTFQTYPIVYTRYSQATFFVPVQRKNMAFVLAKAHDGVPEAEVCQQIYAQTGFRALNKSQFMWKTMDYFLRNTGIPLNFGVTALLALVVGTAIVGQTFYLFTVENLYQFAALKALGVRNARLLGMIVLQAGVVGVIGYGLGVGSAALFGEYVIGHGRLAFFLPWQVLVTAGAAVLLIVTLSSVLSLRRVLVLEPAQVFKS